MESAQGTSEVLLVLFKQRNGNTAKTEEAGWSPKVDFELVENSVVSVSRKKQVVFRLDGVGKPKEELRLQSLGKVVILCRHAPLPAADCCISCRGVGLGGVRQIRRMDGWPQRNGLVHMSTHRSGEDR